MSRWLLSACSALVLAFGVLSPLPTYGAESLEDALKNLKILLDKQEDFHKDYAKELAVQKAERAKARKEGRPIPKPIPIKPTQNLITLNNEIAKQIYRVMILQGYKLGKITYDGDDPQRFFVEIIEGPGHFGNTIRGAQRRFFDPETKTPLKFMVEVTAFRFHIGSYADYKKRICLNPLYLFLPVGEVYNTLLHEIRHAFLFWKIEQGLSSLYNASVKSDDEDIDVTTVERYEQYMNFQELTTHYRDFHQLLSGVNSVYPQLGQVPEKTILMKADKTLSIAANIKKYTTEMLELLKDPKIIERVAYTQKEGDGLLLSKDPLNKNQEVLNLPIYKPGTKEQFGRFKLYLPALKGNESREKVLADARKLLHDMYNEANEVEELMIEKRKGFLKFYTNLDVAKCEAATAPESKDKKD